MFLISYFQEFQKTLEVNKYIQPHVLKILFGQVNQYISYKYFCHSCDISIYSIGRVNCVLFFCIWRVHNFIYCITFYITNTCLFRFYILLYILTFCIQIIVTTTSTPTFVTYCFTPILRKHFFRNFEPSVRISRKSWRNVSCIQRVFENA